jgi:hypothetical protein
LCERRLDPALSPAYALRAVLPRFFALGPEFFVKLDFGHLIV